MWFFSSPAIVFGEGALGNLETIQGQRACIVTDANLVKLGYVERVIKALASTGMQISVIDDVEPDPSLETVKTGAARMLETNPDWIIALGGGSVMDAAKGMWILYEHPDFDPELDQPDRCDRAASESAVDRHPDHCRDRVRNHLGDRLDQSRRAAQTWPRQP